MVFPAVMYGYENWTIKKAEHWRIDAFKLWCWRRLLRVPWTARRSNQSILKEINLNIHWKVWCWSSSTLAPWCFWTVVLEKTLESSLDSKEIKLVNSKGNQACIFIGRTDAEAPILWPDVKNWLIGKNPDAGKDWRQKEKGLQRMRWLDGISDSLDMSLSKL